MRVARPLTIDDRERCMDLAVRVGWPRETAKWDLLFEVGPGYGVERDDGSLDAMVMIPTYETSSFVAMMVVEPVAQGRGLGRALLGRALESAPASVMLYATDRGFPLYRRLGFIEVDRVEKWIGTPMVTTTRQGIVTSSDAARIHAEDRRAFGLSRAALIDRLLARAARVVVDDRGGHALRWHNGHLNVIGPVIAEDEARAITLVDAALEGCVGNARIDVALSSPRLAAHVKALGLASFGQAPLMTKPETLPGERARYHAIALQAFG